MYNDNKLGDKIRFLRKEIRLSQEQLANKLNTTQDTVSLWELNKSYPDIINLIKLCEIFNVSADFLLGLKEI